MMFARHHLRGTIVFIAIFLLTVLPGKGLFSQNKDGIIVNESKIYYGNPKQFSRPAVLSLKEVFHHIPAYKELLKENIAPGDARYWLLLNKANKAFNKALREVAQTKGYDLIGEIGAIRYQDKKRVVPEITALVIEVVEK
jgi:hypothetical protein